MIGKVDFKTARLVKNTLILELTNSWAARQIIKDLKDKEYTATINEKKNRRSLDQNALMWELLTIYAEAQGEKPEDIYIRMLSEHGVAEFLLALPEAEQALKNAFRGVKRVDARTVNGTEMTVFKCYYGSSTYDTKQMTKLIDGIFDELAQIGIDASTSRDVLALHEEWNGR